MPDVKTQHGADLAHHIAQADAWLSASVEGRNTAALSYAALELRFAIERIAIHYWRGLLNRKIEEQDLRDIGSFKRIENRLYQLSGHQKKIDGHFNFLRITLGAIKIDHPIHTPKIADLSRHWHECSELCHIGWTLLSSAQSGLGEAAFKKLTTISKSLSLHATGFGWPMLETGQLAELRDQFVEGTASADDVIMSIKRMGLWARVETVDGRPLHIVGNAVPPNSISKENGN